MLYLFYVDLWHAWTPWYGILMYFVVLIATCKHEKRILLHTLRLHKYNKVDMYHSVPKLNTYEDFANIHVVRESMKAQFHEFIPLA